jgi:hypothetical protein
MKTTIIVVIALLIAGGCCPRPALDIAGAAQPAAAQPAGSITIEIEPGQRWPRWLPVTLAFDTPPAPDTKSFEACVAVR